MSLVQALAILIEYPWLAFVAAGLLLGLGAWRRSATARTAGVFWGLYGVYEYLMYARILCTGECNIRIDLLLLHPALVIVTVLAVLLSVRRGSRRAPLR